MASDRKLGFRVVFAASEDVDYPAAELNYHSPQTKGWQSARFCEFPQEIGLSFADGLVNISQIQLLSHQSKIATRIELFVGTGDSYFDATYTRLGYLSLDSNERTQYKARELKSVYIRARGAFLKLVIHKCYANPQNLFNQVRVARSINTAVARNEAAYFHREKALSVWFGLQVGLIAVNVLGQPASADGSDAGSAPMPLAGPAAKRCVAFSVTHSHSHSKRPLCHHTAGMPPALAFGLASLIFCACACACARACGMHLQLWSAWAA